MTELLEKIKYYQDMFDGNDTVKQKPKTKPKPKPFVKEVTPVNIDISLMVMIMISIQIDISIKRGNTKRKLEVHQNHKVNQALKNQKKNTKVRMTKTWRGTISAGLSINQKIPTG